MSYDHPGYQNPQAPPPYSPYGTGEPKPTAPQFNEYGAAYPPPQPGYPPPQGYPPQMPYAAPQGGFPQAQPMYAPPAPPPQSVYQQQGNTGAYYPQQPYGQGYVQPTGWYGQGQGQGQPQGTTTYVVEENRRNQSSRLADCCLIACCTMLFCELCRICND